MEIAWEEEEKETGRVERGGLVGGGGGGGRLGVGEGRETREGG